LIASRLFLSLVVLQALTGTVVPLICLAFVSPVFGRRSVVRFPEELRRLLYLGSAVLVQIGVFSTRWNVVIGGQLFSKSLRGLTVYKMALTGMEGLFASLVLLAAPFVLLYIFVKLLPPWKEISSAEIPERAADD